MAVISSIGSASARDYADIDIWEADKQGTLTDIQIGECFNDSDFTENYVFLGSTTTASAFMRLTSASDDKHTGIRGTGTTLAASSNGNVIHIQDDFVEVTDLEITHNNEGTSDEGIRVQADNVLIDSCIIYDINDGASQSDGIYTGNWALTGLLIQNCIIINCSRAGIHLQIYNGNHTQDVDIVNNTIILCDLGLAVRAKDAGAVLNLDGFNNLSVNNTTGDWGITGAGNTGTLNISGDYHIYDLDPDAIVPGANSINLAANRVSDDLADFTSGNWVFFVDLTTGSENLHLRGTPVENAAIQGGVGPASQALVPVLDIDGDTRSGSVADVGADEMLVTTNTKTHILQAVLDAGVTTDTRTCILQGVLKATGTKTHILDANLKSVGNTRSHAIQSILKKTNTTTFNLQAILAKSLTVDHVYDATLKKTVSTSYSLSATLKQESASVDHILSAILKGEAGTKDHILQSFLTGAVTKTFVLDATLSSAGAARTFNLQSKLSVTQTASHPLDAILKETGNKTFIVSAVLKESKTGTHILAAGIKGTNTQAYVYGATLKAEQTSRTFTLSGTLKETVSKTHIIQAQLARIITATHSLDANLKGQGQSVDYTLSAVLKAEAGSATHILQSFLSTIKTNTHTLDANLQKTTTLDYALGAALKKQFDKSFDLISILRKTGTDTHSLQSGLKGTISKEFSLDAILGSQSVARSFNLQARLKVAGNTLTHILQANITSSKQVSYILQSVLFNVPGEPVRVFLLGEIVETNLQAGNINNIIDLEGEV